MDTRSKRFDKLSIIKFTCLILSLIFTFAGTMKILEFASFVVENELYDEAAEVLEDTFFSTSESNDSSSKAYEEYRNFVSAALTKGLLYTSPDGKGYSLYKSRVEKAYGKSVIDTILYYKCMNSEYFIFYALDKGYISLELIEPLGRPGNSIFCYENGQGYRIWTDKTAFLNDDASLEKKYTVWDDEDYEDEDYDDEDYTVLTTIMPTVSEASGQSSDRTFCSDRINASYYFDALIGSTRTYEIKENPNGAKYCGLLDLPTEKFNEISADAIIDITNSKYNNEYYNGYYSVKLNMDNINIGEQPAPDEIFATVFGSYDASEEEYIKYCNDLSEKIDLYENIFYAVLDEETGNFSTNYYSDSVATPENIDELLGAYDENFYKISSSDNNIDWKNSFQRSIKDAFYSFSSSNAGSVDGKYTLWVAYDNSLSGSDVFSAINTSKITIASNMKGAFIPFAVCALGYLICLAVLILLSGRKSYDDELHMGKADCIFTDFRTILDLGLISSGVYVLIWLFAQYEYGHYYSSITRIPMILKVAVGALGVILPLILTDWVLYISRHIKNGSLLRNISIVRLISFIGKCSEKRKEKQLLTDAEYKDFKRKVLPIFVPVFVIMNIVVFVSIITASDLDEGFALLFPLLIAFDVFCIWFLRRFMLGIKAIFSAIHSMRMGQQDVSVNINGMPSSLRAYAEDVNSVSEGLSIAVENATKEQRTKTELITNVSHDLKTPLTSIINYVDLLSKRPIDDLEARKYIAVLGEKSEKLKKLIEDLVEASKASAGNIAVNMVKMSVHELISQIIGEFEDDFSKRGLSVIVEEREEDLTVKADSKLACRVLDNLMVNIKKYAMPGTRVYIRVFPDEEYGCIAISNISEQQLNIPASELKGRFVRGDKSRHTEGSGLGLAISEDFMNLQNGKLELLINGDMFTAVIKLKLDK